MRIALSLSEANNSGSISMTLRFSFVMMTEKGSTSIPILSKPKEAASISQVKLPTKGSKIFGTLSKLCDVILRRVRTMRGKNFAL